MPIVVEGLTYILTTCYFAYLDNCSPRKIALPVRVGVWVKVRVSFRVGDNQRIVPEENCPLVRVSFGGGEQFSSGAIVLEPLFCYC